MRSLGSFAKLSNRWHRIVGREQKRRQAEFRQSNLKERFVNRSGGEDCDGPLGKLRGEHQTEGGIIAAQALQCVAIIRAVVRFEKLFKSTIFVGISHGLATEYPTDQGLALELALKRTKTRENGTICSNHSTARFIATHCNVLMHLI
jgi:hypothetical protein